MDLIITTTAKLVWIIIVYLWFCGEIKFYPAVAGMVVVDIIYIAVIIWRNME